MNLPEVFSLKPVKWITSSSGLPQVVQRNSKLCICEIVILKKVQLLAHKSGIQEMDIYLVVLPDQK